ncbi:MAG: GIY-YIG nuclease family protein [Nitrospirota bacterium]
MSKSYVYIVRCNDGTLYTGYTTDLKKREAKHNEGNGAHYTRIRRPIKIVYSEEFETKSEAMKREYQIKCLKREDKERLVEPVLDKCG